MYLATFFKLVYLSFCVWADSVCS